jgi:hypothetical protein
MKRSGFIQKELRNRPKPSLVSPLGLANEARTIMLRRLHTTPRQAVS